MNLILKHVYYLGWNRSPAQVGCMRQVLGPGALGRPRGIGWRGRWEVGSGWGIHVYPWLIHVNVWQKPLQYCKVISLQLIKKIKIKINEPDKSNTQSCFKDEMKKKIIECHEMEAIILLYVIFNKIWLNNFENGVTLTKIRLHMEAETPLITLIAYMFSGS